MPLFHRCFRRAALSLALCATAALSARAQDLSAASSPATLAPSTARLDEILSSQSHARSIGQVAVSPDGKRLAWLRAGQILVAPLDNLGQSQPVTAASPGQSCSASDLVWSPDSTALAFFSDCADPGEQTDLYLSHLDGNPARRITDLRGDVAAPAFSPDSAFIAFLYVEGATRPPGALAAEIPPAGVIGEDHIEIQRVAVVPADSPQPAVPTFATPVNLHVFEFDWSPDSKALAFIAADPPGDDNWWVAKLYTQRLRAPGLDSETWDNKIPIPAPISILSPSEVSGPLHGLQIAVPRWSPDGQQIAFIGGLMSDQGVTGGDVWVVPAVGGDPVDVTPNRPTSAQWIDWAGNQELFVNELAGGNAQLVLLRMHASRGCTFGAGVHGPVFSIPASVSDGRAEMSLSAGAGHNLFVFKASSFDRPEEIYAARADSVISGCAGSEQGNLIQLTHWNDGAKPNWGKAESLSWTNDNFHIQGWLLLPAHYDPAKKYPLIVEVHGGPASAVPAHWAGGAGGLSATVFSALDYFVLLPNPRGSFGQGEAFTQANRKDFGYGDLRDILAGVDAVLAKYPVDPNRIGISGWSYGGFMTMFAVTQTHRFRAGVAGAGISDWLSYYGENSIDQWMIPYFGASVYDDPRVYARSSAINFIKNVTSPTLIVVGDRDGECPAPQSFEFWHALRDLHVPTQLVVYPNEGHGFVDPADRRDVLQRAVDWFARYMPPGP
jgi:dipeptidyl aminopeptidase/acylaminoacyl peptidase